MLAETPGPSPHLTWAELACHDGTPYPLDWRYSRAIVLAAEFEAIRAVVGVPLIVTSGYRTPSWNENIGGKPQSQHLEGCALDVVPVRPVPLRDLYAAVVARARMRESAIRYIEDAGTWVHFDIRSSAQLIIETPLTHSLRVSLHPGGALER